MSNRASAKADVLPGTLDVMLLRTVSVRGPLHGYAIAARLAQISRGALRLNMGTLYPGLIRLEERRLLRAVWGVTETNRHARFYTITAAGRRRLAAGTREWDRMTAIMHALLHGEESGVRSAGTARPARGNRRQLGRGPRKKRG